MTTVHEDLGVVRERMLEKTKRCRRAPDSGSLGGGKIDMAAAGGEEGGERGATGEQG